MVAFTLEGVAYRSKGLGQRKDLLGDEQISVPSSYGMPVNAFRCYGDLRH